MSAPHFSWMNMVRWSCPALMVLLMGSAGCGHDRQTEPNAESATNPSSLHAHHHHHEPPHGGTAIVLGQEAFHVELVLEREAGRMKAFLLDGHMESFVRAAMPEFVIRAKTATGEERLVFRAVTTTATGEKVGDTALFEAEAPWLSQGIESLRFEGVIEVIQLRGQTFRDVQFRFPEGNEANR